MDVNRRRGHVKHVTAAGILVMLLGIMLSAAYFSVPTDRLAVRAQPSTVLGVWSSTYGSNIEDVSLVAGSTFDVKVNITGADPIIGYDVFLDYDFVALGPPCEPPSDPDRCILDAVSATFLGGLIDPVNPPDGCNVFVSRFEVVQPLQTKGNIRVGVVIIGPCSVNGTGTLFTITFNVLALGATNISIVEANGSSSPPTKIIGTGSISLPYQTTDAYFRNKAGTPPVADFSFDPSNPVRGQEVTFDATSSLDPSNSTQGPEKGIKRYVWSFGDNTANRQGSSPSHLFVVPVSNPTTGNFSVTLVVWDYDDDLPRGVTKVVEVAEATVHNVLVLAPSLGRSVVTAGETLAVTVTVFNRGTVADIVSLVVSYDYNGTTIVGSDTGISLDVDGSRQVNYELPTSGLPARVYTVTAAVEISNPEGGTIPDARPSDNTRSSTFQVTGTGGRTSPLSIPLLAGAVVAVLVIVGAVFYAVRRRARKET